MRTLIRTGLVAQAAAASGGTANMSHADRGRVGAAARREYAYLSRFAGQLVDGSRPLDASAVRRAGMYAEAGRRTAEEVDRRSRQVDGWTLERRVLAAAEHCVECLALAALGWQPLGSLPRIGETICKMGCRCSWGFKRGASDATAPVAATAEPLVTAPVSPITAEAIAAVGDRSNVSVIWKEEKDFPGALQARTNRFLGRAPSNEELARLLMATEGATITASRGVNGVKFVVEVSDGERSIQATRELDERRGLIITNRSIEIKGYPRGTGTKLFADQVEQAASMHGRYIRTHADGHPGGGPLNGYYTWARLGYNAGLPASVKAAFPGVRDMNEFMIRGGREWWRAHGEAFDGRFNLHAGSRSRRILDAYTRGETT